MDVNSLPKTVTRQRRDCDLNPGTSAPESSTLATRLPSHPSYLGPTVISSVIHVCFSISHLTTAPASLSRACHQPRPSYTLLASVIVGRGQASTYWQARRGDRFQSPIPIPYPQKKPVRIPTESSYSKKTKSFVRIPHALCLFGCILKTHIFAVHVTVLLCVSSNDNEEKCQ